MDMNRMRLTALTAFATTILVLGTNALGDDISPNDLMKKVASAYEAAKTYKAEGTVSSDIETGGTKTKIEISFSILLKKPNQYLISWSQKNMSTPDVVVSGSVWNDGTQPYLYMGIMNAYSKMTTDETALGAATGISGGATFTIPFLFLPVSKEQQAPFSRLKDPKIERVEKVGEEECYVLTSPSTISKEETLWISKTSYLIKKYSRSFEAPEGGVAIPEITDKQLEEAIKGMGQEVTAESKKNVMEMIERSKTIIKTAKLKGTSVEIHANVSSPELDKSDFKFALPKGTVLKDSLFDGIIGENKGISNKAIDSDKK